MKWTWWRWWRLWLAQTLGLVLFALAGWQATQPAAHQLLIIGVATKVITGLLAIMLVRIPQDHADQLQQLRGRVRQLERNDDGDGTPP